MANKKSFGFVLVLIILVLSTSCAQRKTISLQKLYGVDADYFEGLNALKNQEEKKALRLFNNAIAKGSKYISRRALEQKSKLGNLQDKLKCAEALVEKYQDSDALLFASREFFEAEEFSKIISFTEKIDLATEDNRLVKIRLDAMKQKSDTRLESEVMSWFIEKRISLEHYEFYKNFDSDISLELKTILAFRIAIYQKKYAESFAMLEDVKDILLNKKSIFLTYQLMSDMGRSCLYASDSNITNARFFSSLAEDFSLDAKARYYAWIYAGRIYDKNSKYVTQSCNRFKSAMENACTTEDYDMALWFLLNEELKRSPENAVDAVEKYCTTWSSASYFSDFFDSLSVRIFSAAKWELIPRVYSLVNNFADGETVAKYAYLTGRLYQEKYLESSDSLAIQEDAFLRAFEIDYGTSVYYKILSGKQLGYSKEQIDFELNHIGNANEKNLSDEDAEKLIRGYADFGFPELVYSEWQRFYNADKNLIGIETALHAAKLLRNSASEKDKNYFRSLQIISRTANSKDAIISRDVFSLVYPKNYEKYIAESAKEFGVDEYVMFALIRTESFFDSQIQSQAGAVGLTQLMEFTASDCANRLKLNHFDITEPATNIRLGTYYFSSLTSRLNNSEVMALFAYNAGITRVRQWVRSSRIELGNRRDLPSDFFLETLPFEETRNYGRSVIAASAMYGWLYYDKNPTEIITSMMPR